MGTKNIQVDAYIARAQPFARPILKHLRFVVHGACPQAEEKIKWGFPHFDYHGMLCSMAAFKEHCSFGFWKSSLLRDREGTLRRTGEGGMGNFGRIQSLSDLPPDAIIRGYVKEAMKLNTAGVPLKRSRPAKVKELKIPRYFLAALSRKARATFDAFSPSQKKEYVEWVEEAKTEETRSRRLENTVQWLEEGKTRNWKYM